MMALLRPIEIARDNTHLAAVNRRITREEDEANGR